VRPTNGNGKREVKKAKVVKNCQRLRGGGRTGDMRLYWAGEGERLG